MEGLIKINDKEYVWNTEKQNMCSIPEGINFPLKFSPFCEKCKCEMNFFYSLNDKYDFYDCKCGSSKQVLKDFRVIEKKEEMVEETAVIEDNNSDNTTIEDVLLEMEIITLEVMNEFSTPESIERFLRYISSSEKRFHYFCEGYLFYESSSDIRVVMHEMYSLAVHSLNYLDQRNQQHIKHFKQMIKKYPVRKRKIQRPVLDFQAARKIHYFLAHLISLIPNVP